MKVVGGVAAFAVMILIAGSARGLNVTDTSFTSGTVFQTVASGGNLTLSGPGGGFFPAGNYTSGVFDAGAVVNWTNVTWAGFLNVTAGNVIKIQARAGNTSAPDPSWKDSQNYTSPSPLAVGFARFIGFVALLETGDTASSPVLEEVSLSYEPVPVVVSLTSPASNSIQSSPSLGLNCTASSPNGLQTITLYTDLNNTWAANATLPVAGESAAVTFSFSRVPDGTYRWNCVAADQAGQTGTAPANATVVVASANTPPTIVASVSPSSVAVGSNVSLRINATDPTGISAVWATLTTPNSSTSNLSLVNGGEVNYTAAQQGNYLVAFFANDTAGAISSIQSTFRAAQVLNVTISVTNASPSGIAANLTLLKAGAVAAAFSSQTGTFPGASALQDTYDILISGYGKVDILFKDVDLAAAQNAVVGLDSLSGVSGFLLLYAVSNPFTITGGQVTITYSPGTFVNDSSVAVFVCTPWNFSGRTCAGNFTPVATAAHNQAARTVALNVTGFSAFALQQGSFCGDSVCSGSETNATCPQDCQCAEGDTRACGTSQTGECSLGIQTCSGGMWGTCVGETAPAPEVCNQRDDNCDGTVDNVNGATSAAAAGCACFGGAAPQATETCNGIDDDCDGTVDGFNKPCGSTVGICRPGTQVCTAGVLGNCTGGVNAAFVDTCGNSLDDNCNARVDEGCSDCANGRLDEGEEGVDCGGLCGRTCPPPQPPFLWIGAAAVAFILAALFALKRRSGWGALERKYYFRPG